MCFSAEASFVAGGVLSAVGIYSLVVNKNPKYIPLATIPLLFGIQQLAEGGVRISLLHQDRAMRTKTFTYIFLFFSQIFRETRVPFSFRRAELPGMRKKLLGALTIMGSIASVYLVCVVIAFGGTASIVQEHIVYHLSIAQPLTSIEPLMSVCYLLSILVAPFISSLRKVKMLGIILLATAIVAYMSYAYYFVSVRCFFAAIVSIFLVHILLHNQKRAVVL